VPVAVKSKKNNKKCCVQLRSLEDVRWFPSTMARLVFLSGLRDFNSGTYQAPYIFKADASDVDALFRGLHEEAFSIWLNYCFEEQRADLDLYFSGLECGKDVAVRTWLHLEPYRSFAPISASVAERDLFFSDIKMVLCLMAREDPSIVSAIGKPLVDGSFPTVRDVSCSLDARGVQLQASECPVKCLGPQVLDLSTREREVFALIGQGKVTKEIAALLSVSEHTVGEYRKRICKKLGLHSTVELAVCAARRLGGSCRWAGLSRRECLTLR